MPPPRASPTRPIDDLLDQVSSKYALVIYAAKRARQINDYYSQLGEGLLEYVGPLVEPGPREKPLSIAMREIQAGLLEHTEGASSTRFASADAVSGDSVAGTSRARVLLGVAGGIAAYKACELLRRLTESGHAVRVLPTGVGAGVRRRRHVRGAVRAARAHRGVRRRPGGRRTSSWARRPTWWSSPRRRRTCWPGPRTAAPTTC